MDLQLARIQWGSAGWQPALTSEEASPAHMVSIALEPFHLLLTAAADIHLELFVRIH